MHKSFGIRGVLALLAFVAVSPAWALDEAVAEIRERKANGWWTTAYYKPGTNGTERAYRPYAFGGTINWNWAEVKDVGPGAKLVCLEVKAAKLNKIYAVKVDLTTPGLNFIGAIRCDAWGAPMTDVDNVANAYTVREKTEDFIVRSRGTGSRLARNREVFLGMNSAAWGPWRTARDTRSTYANPNGPLYSLGVQISSSGTGYGTHGTAAVPHGVFVFRKDRTADIIPQVTPEIVKEVWFSLPCFVHRLLVDGRDGSTLTRDRSRAQRTSIGLSRDRKTAYLVFCDGRNAAWSSGLTFVELAHVHRAVGSWDAINLDGGGSTTLMTWDAARHRPYMHNWQTSTRRNGSNMGLYVKAPEVKCGANLYDDLESALRDAQGGALPKPKLDIIADVTVTEACTGITGKVALTLSSTNGATLGWVAGLVPTVPANARLAFKGVALREGARELTVAAGGTLVVDGSLGLNVLRTADRGGFVLGGALGGRMLVDCAAAKTAGAAFGTSSLSLAATRRELAKLGCATDPKLGAAAAVENGVVVLKWAGRKK